MIKTIIQEIKEQLEQHFEPFLNPPATVEQIEEAEQQMGIKLPDVVRDLYLTHNGESDDGPGLFFGLPFLSLEVMLAEWQNYVEISEDEELQQIESYSVPEEWIKEQYFNRHWIPIAHDDGGNYLGIDLDPDDSGIRGQVINFGRDETVKFVIAHNLTDLLKYIAETLKNGIYTVDEDNYWSYGHKEDAHFFDELQNLELPIFHPKTSNKVAGDEWFQKLSDQWKEIVQSLAKQPEEFLKSKILHLIGKNITDISPLSSCVDVRSLSLSGNRIMDIAPLQELSTLKTLYLGGNPIMDITPLGHLNKLQFLNLSRTFVKDASPLSTLPNLKELAIEHTPIQDISPLQNLKSLHTLSVCIRNVKQFNALTDIRNLKQLHIHQLIGLTEADLKLFEKLINLETLTIENGVFNNLDFLANNQKLKKLTFVNSFVPDASSIKKLTALTHLECNNTPIGNIEVVAEVSSLKSFAGSFQQFSVLKPLRQDMDFSKMIGEMSEEEENIWRNSFN